MSRKKAVKGEIKKIVKEDSSWSLKSIVVASATGVSVALISTKLAGFLNSVVLVAVMAFISATVSEFYRIFVALSALGAKKVVERSPLSIGGDSGVSSVDSQVDATEAIDTITKAFKLPEKELQAHPSVGGRGVARVKHYLRSNPFVLMVCLSLFVSLFTIAASYVASNSGVPDVVKETVVVREDVSEAEKQDLVNQAVDKVKPGTVSIGEVESLRSEIDLLKSELQSTKSELNTVRGGLTNLESSGARDLGLGVVPDVVDNDNSNLLSQLQGEVQTLKAENLALKQRLYDLEQRFTTG